MATDADDGDEWKASNLSTFPLFIPATISHFGKRVQFCLPHFATAPISQLHMRPPEGPYFALLPPFVHNEARGSVKAGYGKWKEDAVTLVFLSVLLIPLFPAATIMPHLCLEYQRGEGGCETWFVTDVDVRRRRDRDASPRFPRGQYSGSLYFGAIPFLQCRRERRSG